MGRMRQMGELGRPGLAEFDPAGSVCGALAQGGLHDVGREPMRVHGCLEHNTRIFGVQLGNFQACSQGAVFRLLRRQFLRDANSLLRAYPRLHVCTNFFGHLRHSRILGRFSRFSSGVCGVVRLLDYASVGRDGSEGSLCERACITCLHRAPLLRSRRRDFWTRSNFCRRSAGGISCIWFRCRTNKVRCAPVARPFGQVLVQVGVHVRGRGCSRARAHGALLAWCLLRSSRAEYRLFLELPDRSCRKFRSLPTLVWDQLNFGWAGVAALNREGHLVANAMQLAQVGEV